MTPAVTLVLTMRSLALLPDPFFCSIVQRHSLLVQFFHVKHYIAAQTARQLR